MSFRFKQAALGAAVTCIFSQVAVAIEDEAAVVVTATRFFSDRQGQPIAAQVISAEEIRNSSAITVSEVLSKLGGVHTRINLTGIPDSPIDLRGFGFTGDQNTLVLVNGQRISENEGAPARLSSIPINSIERIEILRGAGAVLYGGGTTGGTINIITQAPQNEGLTGNAALLSGSHNLRDLRGGIQYRKGEWGITLSGQRYGSDNYRHGNRADLEAVSGEVRYGSQEDFIALSFNSDDQKSRLPGVRRIDPVIGLDQFSNDPRGVTTPHDYLNSQSELISVRGEKRLGEITLALDIGQRDKIGRSYGSYDRGGTSLADTHAEITTLSPRLLWKTLLAGMDNRLTLGTDWSDWSYSNKTLGTGGAFSLNEAGNQTHRAIYFRNELFITRGTRLSIGARREHIKQDDTDNLVPRPKESAEHHLSAYELALQQDLGAGYRVYGRLGRSFRVANIDENRCTPWMAACVPLLKPQTSQDRELGIQWSGKGASLRASIFEMDVRNEIHYNGIDGSNMNLPPTRHRGFEFEGRLPVGDTLDFGARYAWTQARFREGIYMGFDSNNFFAPFSADLSGKDIPLVPRHRFGLNLGWQMAVSTRLTFGANYVGHQRYDNDQGNLYSSMPSYTTADVKITHDIGAWRLAAGINNLFDKAYYSYGVTNISVSPTRHNVYPEDRRNGYLSAEYRF